MKYQWQGENVKVKFGYCKVSECKENLLMWYNYEVIQLGTGFYMTLIPAIMINDEFCIANHFGIGVHKLKNGGWPNYSHFSLPEKTFVEDNSPAYKLTSFDLENYSQHESERNVWQKLNFPEEYKRIEQLKEVAKNVRSSFGCR